MTCHVDDVVNAAHNPEVVVLVDVPGVTVIDTDDALLIVSRDNAERVREVIEELRRRRRKDLL